MTEFIPTSFIIKTFFLKSDTRLNLYEYLFCKKRKLHSTDLKDIISKPENKFVILTFLDERRRFWTNEKLRNFFFNFDEIEIVYYIVSNGLDFCMLFRTRFESKPLYVEIIYFNNRVETIQKTKRRGWRRGEVSPLQNSIIVTYSVQRFLDYIVSNYDHKDVYPCNWPGEKWEVEDRDFIFENILVCRAIEHNDIGNIERLWSQQEHQQQMQQLSSLQQLCRGIIYANRETLWKDSTRTGMSELVGDEMEAYNIKVRHERRVLLTNIDKVLTYKTFTNIIPYFGCRGVKEDKDIYNQSFENSLGHSHYYSCSPDVHEEGLVFKYLANRYSKSYTPSEDIDLEIIYRECLNRKKELEIKYYPKVCFPPLN